jgi:hypothetical protein
MVWLLRKLPDKDAWAAAEGSPLWAEGDCPPEVLVQVFDNRKGVSTWRVNNQEEEERVIAAQAFLGRSIPNDFTYFLIEEDVLRQAGITLKDSPAKTPDKEVDNFHVDVIELSGKQLIQFANILNTKCKPKVMTRTEILEMAAKCFRDEKFDRDFLFASGGRRGRSEEEIAASRKLLVDLWKKGLINISVSQSG